jgi:hypothetical protein
MGESTAKLTRLEYQTIEDEFVVEQITSYMSAGITVYLPMPELRVARLVSGTRNTDSGVRVEFADPGISPKTYRAGDQLDILVLRP